MSPEQLLGDPVDARSDIYSLGCILYMMLTGEPTFSASTREQMIKRRLSESPPHPSVLVPELHPTLDAVVFRMLERAPAARFNTSADVRDALERAVASKYPTPSMTYIPTPRSVPTLSMDEVTEEKVPPPGKPSRSRRVIWGTAVAATVFAGATLLVHERNVRLATADSVRLAASNALARAAQLHSDSLKAGKPPAPDTGAVASSTPPPRDTTTRAPKLTPAQTQVRAAIDRYRAAFESRDIAKVLQFYPSMPVAQQKNWRDNVFADAAAVHAEVTYDRERILGDSADVDFTMKLRNTYAKGRPPTSYALKYRATLAHEGGAWVFKRMQQQ
jgi:serine/threonine protein kinase